jgi:hypothetical protein
MEARFCSNCGTPTVPGDRFCRTCGETLVEATIAMPREFIREPAAYAGGQPLAQFEVAYPPRLSRLLIFVKWLLAIPHFVVLYLYGMAFSIVSFIAWFAILFTGRYPRGMFEFALGYLRWNSNVYAYCFLLRDEYPPFSSDENAYPVQFSLGYPERLSRWKIFLKWLLIIPNWLVLYFLLVAVMATSFVAWFAILFTGRYPEGLFRFAVGVMRWAVRATTYLYLLTDHYPPFTTAALPQAQEAQLMPA